jgi:hypothetical protein
MLTKAVLETTFTFQLVALCRKVIESNKATALESEECGEMIKEWDNLKEGMGKESEFSRLRNKMISLLGVTANRLGIQ